MEIKCKAFQERVLESKKKFVIIKSAWGTGKTLFGILKCFNLAKNYPNNLIMICRAEYTDLRDSTIKDFTTYTGMAPDSSREVKFANGSIIMFRHLEELSEKNLQNINLGAFMIEQAEELETDNVFYLLMGRLRRKDSSRQGILLANANGHNWIYKLGIEGLIDPQTNENLIDYITATSYDNRDVIPEDTFRTWELMKDKKPAIYNRFVLNSDDEDNISDYLIPGKYLEMSVNVPKEEYIGNRIIVSCDPARFGDDETVIYVIKNNYILDHIYIRGQDLMQTASRCLYMAHKHKASDIIIDSIGIGAGVVDRLREMTGINVIEFNGASRNFEIEEDQEDVKKQYLNLRALAYDRVADKIKENKVYLDVEKELFEQLSAIKYTFRNGKLKIEAKEDIKEAKRLGRSPDRADCLIMGLYWIDYAETSVRADKRQVFTPMYSKPPRDVYIKHE